MGASKKCKSRPTVLIRTLSFFGVVMWMLTFVQNINCENLECPSPCSCFKAFVVCSKQELVHVPKDIPISTESLDLSSNLLRNNASDVFRKLLLPVLSKLNLSDNLLEEIPTFNNMRNLAYLGLSRNKIHILNSEALERLNNLQFLDLSNNRLYEISENGFPRGSAIHSLNLNKNRIAIIHNGSLENLSNLTELKMNHNHLSKFSKELFKDLRHVKVLEINRNRFTKIESLTFNGLDGLMTLKLRRNSIRTLWDGAFFDLQNMTILQLDHNSISSITKGGLYGLASLHQLSLSNNHIDFIEDDGWEFCPQLIELDLSNNRLHSIEKGTFEHLSRLQRLRLDNNKIAYIADGAFNNIPALEILELNSNHISSTIEEMNGAFLGLNRLIKFGLASNHIKSINIKAFLGLERLKKMDLSNNSINLVQENAFAGMIHLQELHINTTSLLCDCNVKWLPLWLSKTNFAHTVEAVCAYPENLKGKAINHVPTSNLTCDDFPIPHIIENPKTQIALKGANVTLQCKASSSTDLPMTFQWKRNNIDLAHVHVRQFARSPAGKGAEQTSQLTLLNITHNDAGKYQCVVSNAYAKKYSAKAKITVLIFPSFHKIPGNVTVRSGSTARLECAARGQPNPQIIWQKDGGDDFPAARERRLQVMPADDAFFIIDVKASDMGVYSCTAQNLAGVIVANASLTVIEPPAFVKAMEDKEITAGEPIVLECMASGSPKPKLTWTKDDGSLLTTERHFFTADDQLLIIVDTAVSDGGKYECTMTNPLGSETGFSRLSVVPASGSVMNDSDMTGIIIITVVCCAVGTSIIWVVIIYQTRKRGLGMGLRDVGRVRCTIYTGTTLFPSLDVDFQGSMPQLYFDSNSEHSSGKEILSTVDSAKRSSNDLLLPNDLDLNITGGSSDSLELSAAPMLSEEGSKTLGLETGQHPRRTDHNRCCEGMDSTIVNQRWSAPHFTPVPAPIAHLNKVSSYQSLQPTHCAASHSPY